MPGNSKDYIFEVNRKVFKGKQSAWLCYFLAIFNFMCVGS